MILSVLITQGQIQGFDTGKRRHQISIRQLLKLSCMKIHEHALKLSLVIL